MWQVTDHGQITVPNLTLVGIRITVKFVKSQLSTWLTRGIYSISAAKTASKSQTRQPMAWKLFQKLVSCKNGILFVLLRITLSQTGNKLVQTGQCLYF